MHWPTLMAAPESTVVYLLMFLLSQLFLVNILLLLWHVIFTDLEQFYMTVLKRDLVREWEPWKHKNHPFWLLLVLYWDLWKPPGWERAISHSLSSWKAAIKSKHGVPVFCCEDLPSDPSDFLYLWAKKNVFLSKLLKTYCYQRHRFFRKAYDLSDMSFGFWMFAKYNFFQSLFLILFQNCLDKLKERKGSGYLQGPEKAYIIIYIRYRNCAHDISVRGQVAPRQSGVSIIDSFVLHKGLIFTSDICHFLFWEKLLSFVLYVGNFNF